MGGKSDGATRPAYYLKGTRRNQPATYSATVLVDDFLIVDSEHLWRILRA